MPEATFEGSNGTKTTVGLTDEQLARILEVIGGSDDIHPTDEQDAAPAAKPPKVTIKSLIRTLVDEGFFPNKDTEAEGKSLEDIRKALQRRGYRFKNTSLSGRLTDLVREGVLVRKGDPRKFGYYRSS